MVDTYVRGYLEVGKINKQCAALLVSASLGCEISSMSEMRQQLGRIPIESTFGNVTAP